MSSAPTDDDLLVEVLQCERCGAVHFETDDADLLECKECKIGTLVPPEVAVTPAEPTDVSSSPSHPIAGLIVPELLGMLGIVTASLSGIVLSDSSAVQEVESATGTTAIAINFDAAFWIATALLGGAIVLLGIALTTSARWSS